MWGLGAAQIFSDVSPAMPGVCLTGTVRWFQRFGLNYYGCREPLHRKIDVVGHPQPAQNLHESWVNVEVGAERMGNRYVFSRKPNPAMLAVDTWDPETARQDLVDTLTKTRAHGCVVEIIMKDISTVRYQPQRLWEWSRIAAEVTQDFA